MNPKDNERIQPDVPETEVQIPHEEPEAPPITAPPLPIIEPTPAAVEPTVSPQPEQVAIIPELHEEIHEHEGRRWPVILIYTALAFLVALLVVLAGRWLYQKATGNKAKPAGPTTTQQTQGQGTTPPASPTTAPNSSASSVPNPPVATNGQLPNNGPGDVVAIFIGTALLIGGIHFIYNLRKQN